MSDLHGMTPEEYIAALRSDLGATSAERNAAAAAGRKSAADLTAERKQHEAAEAEIARLEADIKAKSTPDAQIAAGLRAIGDKFKALLGR